ncbi:MAG: hypothetical protein N2C14_17965 [Planctomycetales bacterium]
MNSPSDSADGVQEKPDAADAKQDSEESRRASLRWSVYWLLIFISAGSMVGRILAVNSVDAIKLEQRLYKQGRKDWRQQRPFLSANDRSRWCTIRALVEKGTYSIDEIESQPGWDTIDKVYHKQVFPEGRFYSSKPPLFPTLLAGEYYVIHKLTGATLGTHPHAIGRLMLITTNVIPLIIVFYLLAHWVERFGTTDWGRIFVMACAAMGTFLTTFAVTLNNHLPAVDSAAIALAAAIPVWLDNDKSWGRFAVAGLFAAFVAANELPALSFFCLLGLVMFWKSPGKTMAFGVPAALVVIVAVFATNYVAHNDLKPPYAHRTPGENWYDYPGSHWKTENRGGIDRGEKSKAVYALHALVGGHGIFSLTPIWILSFAGMGALKFRREHPLRPIAIFTAILTLVCLLFYLNRPVIDRNYGGMTSGFRWMFWFAPMWLLTMIPAADYCSRKKSLRILAGVFLALSVLSASYPTWNPWTNPWIRQLLLHEGWISG